MNCFLEKTKRAVEFRRLRIRGRYAILGKNKSEARV